MNVKLRVFDPAEFLDDEETIAHYLADAAADENPDAFLEALGDVARARGMSDIARRTGLGRQNLYRALSPGANPSYHTLRKVMAALGVAFTTQTTKPAATQGTAHA